MLLVQSEKLRSEADKYWGFEWRMEGCKGHMGPAFQRCKDSYSSPENLHSEAQIGKHAAEMSRFCNVEAVREYYKCLGPPPNER